MALYHECNANNLSHFFMFLQQLNKVSENYNFPTCPNYFIIQKNYRNGRNILKFLINSGLWENIPCSSDVFRVKRINYPFYITIMDFDYFANGYIIMRKDVVLFTFDHDIYTDNCEIINCRLPYKEIPI